jgi:hypothetical protein
MPRKRKNRYGVSEERILQLTNDLAEDMIMFSEYTDIKLLQELAAAVNYWRDKLDEQIRLTMAVEGRSLMTAAELMLDLSKMPKRFQKRYAKTKINKMIYGKLPI